MTQRFANLSTEGLDPSSELSIIKGAHARERLGQECKGSRHLGSKLRPEQVEIED